ncbi:18307_t:CDS:2, partial [Racocetra fulgida]
HVLFVKAENGSKTNEYYAYQNRTEYAQVLLTVAQWVLRRQLYVLIHEMGFEPQIEVRFLHSSSIMVHVPPLKDLDAMDINPDVSEASSSVPQEYDDNLEFLINIPQDSDSGGKSDGHQKSSGNEFSDLNSSAKKMTYNALPCRLSNMSLKFDFIAFYKKFYGITFPEINAPPILYRFIRDFMLPDEFFLYFPNFEDWIKKLSERQEKLFSKEIPLDLSDLKEWIDSNPDKYIKHCSDTLVGRKRWPQKPKDTQNSAHINREKRIEEMEQVSKPFRELSETVVPVIEEQVRKEKLKNFLDTTENQLGSTSRALTVQEFYKMQRKKELDKNIIKNFENSVNDFIEPIEKEIQDLNFCVEVPDKQTASESCLFSEDPLSNLRNRYSTFLYKNIENNNSDQPNLTFGEKYTAYQIFQNRSDFHEDYERILVFASKMVNATMHDVQQAVMKVE